MKIKNMIIRNLLLLIFLLSITFSKATEIEPVELFKIGNEAYANEDFYKAIEYYTQIINHGYETENLYYNLGNSYYKSGDIASAILYYEKSLKLNPANADARFNLKICNQKTIDKIEPLPELSIISWWRGIVFSKKADGWGWLTIQSLFLSFLLFSGYVLANRIILKKIAFFSGLVLIVASVLFFILGYQQKDILNSSDYAIVFSPSLTVRSAPDNSGTKLFVIHVGAKVQVLDSLSDWRKISISNGSIGWVKSEAMEKI